MGGFRKGGFSNNRFVLKHDVAIASEVSILSKNSLAITDFQAKKTQHVQLFENPLPGTPPIRDSQLKTTRMQTIGLANYRFRNARESAPHELRYGLTGHVGLNWVHASPKNLLRLVLPQTLRHRWPFAGVKKASP